MATDGLFILAPLRSDADVIAVRKRLKEIGDAVVAGDRQLATEPGLEINRSSKVHFARFAVLDDPDRGEDCFRLLFSTDYDGNRKEHISEVIGLTRKPEALWGCCEGYAGPENFEAFVDRWTMEPGAYYMAYRKQSLSKLRWAIGEREWYQSQLRRPDASRVFRFLPAMIRNWRALQVWKNRLVLIFVGPLKVALALFEFVRVILTCGFWNTVKAARAINQSLSRVWWIRLLRFVGIGSRPPVPPPHNYSETTTEQLVESDREDEILQNQLTLVTDVSPEQLGVLRAVLGLIDLYGKRLSLPGKLVGISTIHTVRWALIDEGRRLVMLSNYDSSWENYIDEFAEMILSGLDALWTSAPDYPKAGAQDVAALKQFLRNHQARVSMFYSAYPEATVLNLLEDLEWARGVVPTAREMVNQFESNVAK